ncbi:MULTISPECIES: hypothetical protein [unclassified Nocardioides]|uniref:hypothetical protein n=1 Tax=unclassified Nocardioides TaxID=2615069 RepID=UPI000056F8F7|nr:MULTISPECIES: hypothetical protein [unclassified Nocardioides]ABL80549.1 hypothetical protein Noca_1030 [Nocardioides sp. JS614]
MSKYVSQRTLVTAQISAELATSLGLTTEQSDLVLHAGELRANNNVTQLDALLATHGDALQAATSQLVPDATTDVNLTIDKAAARVRGAVTKRLFDDALAVTKSADLGFSHVAWTLEPDVATIRATSTDGNGILDIRVDRATGEMERDWEVGSGDACVELDRKVVAGLRLRGWALETTSVDQHNGKRDGARLIKPADASSPDSPTVGAVLDHRAREGRPIRRITDESDRQTAPGKQVVK